jgi:replicative DNA helicase
MTQTAIMERPLPQNLDAERSILGAILLDNHSLNAALEKIRSEDFFLESHRRIFECMSALGEKHQAIDLITLSEELSRNDEIDAAGGFAYLAQLADGVPRVTNVEHYSRIVKEKALLRNLIHAADAIQQRALDAEEDADAILDQAESQIFKLAEDRVRAGFVDVKRLVSENFERLQDIFTKGKRITGLSTGYPRLDGETAGLQPSELIILAARPSMGKTALALNIAENVAVQQQAPVAIFSLEMSKESLLLRLLSSVGRINAHSLRTGHLSRQDWSGVSDSLGKLAGSPLWIDDSASITVLEMGAQLRRLKREHDISLVIVDYIQLIATRGRFGNRNEEVTSISRSLKALAKELRVPILVLSQLTRAPEREDRRPQLADLRESGAIEQDADVVLFIHRPDFYKKDLPEDQRNGVELIIAKQRNGPVGILPFVFISKHTLFQEAAQGDWGGAPQD